PRLQFLVVERLLEIVVGPRVKALDHVLLTIPAREENDVGVRLACCLSHSPADLYAVEAWHHPIEERDRRRFWCLERAPGLIPVLREDDLVSPGGERALEQVTGEARVLSEQNPHGRSLADERETNTRRVRLRALTASQVIR